MQKRFLVFLLQKYRSTFLPFQRPFKKPQSAIYYFWPSFAAFAAANILVHYSMMMTVLDQLMQCKCYQLNPYNFQNSNLLLLRINQSVYNGMLFFSISKEIYLSSEFIQWRKECLTSTVFGQWPSSIFFVVGPLTTRPAFKDYVRNDAIKLSLSNSCLLTKNFVKYYETKTRLCKIDEIMWVRRKL